MRKRRVFALLLALSLAVSGNGMTALAVEPGAGADSTFSMPDTVTQGSESGEEQSKGETAGGSSGEENKTEGNELPSTGEEQKPTEGGSTEGETPAEPEKPVEPEEPAEPEKPVEPEKPAEPEKPTEEAKPAEGEKPAGEEMPAEGEQPTEPEQPVKEEQPEEETKLNTVRMVTFTDDTGMKITYDANASQQYVYTVENGVLTSVMAKGEGEDAVDRPVTFTGNVELKQPETGEKYTSVAAGIFAGNTEVTYVKLPAGVTMITAGAFKGCTSLKGVFVPSSVTTVGSSAFEGCTAMSQIALPKAVTEIGASAFKGDSRLHLVYMKNADDCALTSIGNNAFDGCSVLADFCSDKEFFIPSKLERIEAGAFQNCKAIKKIDFTDTKVTELGEGVFKGCAGLTDLTPGKRLALIPTDAFADCKALAAINFEDGNDMTIAERAFANCSSLKQLVLPQSIKAIKNDAFVGCNRLTRVEIKRYKIELEDRAFPVGTAENLVIIAEKGSNGYEYAVTKDLQPDAEGYYKYTVEDAAGGLVTDGKFPGGKLWVCAAGETEYSKNINTLNKSKGVKSDDKTKYYIYTQANDGFEFVSESLRCNGQPVKKEDGKYYFTMPVGGVVITAEFRAKTTGNIKGTTVTIEFSDGEPLRNGATDQYGYHGVKLKAGQTTRMYVLDEDGEPIPASKISKITSSDEKVAKVDKNGVITAVGTGSSDEADATIRVEVNGSDGKTIAVNRTILVVSADEAKSMTLRAVIDADDDFKVSIKNGENLQTAVIKKSYVSKEKLSFELRASVSDGVDNISKELSWTSSNPKVATVKNAKTGKGESKNEVTVLKGCEGEATITVTATNGSNAEKEKVTGKFVVQVYQDGYKLASSSVTINPNCTNGGTIELLSADGGETGNITVELYEEKTMAAPAFMAKLDAEASKDNCKTFHIIPVASTIKNGTYKVRVGVNGNKAKADLMPLTITIKKSTPAPTIKFNTKKAKFNLFYKDGRSSVNGKPTEVVTEITKLGETEIEDVKLEPLTNKADDGLFTKNFVIDEQKSDLSKGTVVIKRSGDDLYYTSKKKPAVTGYLVVYFKGFEKSAAKKMKVTMPNTTTAPSYALRDTKGTYLKGGPAQKETFEIYDKKSSTKEQVKLDGKNTVKEVQQDLTLTQAPVIKDGVVELSFIPEKGKLKLALTDSNWERDKNGKERVVNLTYTVSVSSSKPTIKAKQVSVNLNYPSQDANFTLTSTVKGVDIFSSQTFQQVRTKSNGAEIDKLNVSYTNGKGQVTIKSGQKVKRGTYKFECYPQTDWPEDLKKVTLSIKVVDNKPTLKLGKGSLQVDQAALIQNSKTTGEEPKAVEPAEISFTVTGKPDGYNLKEIGNDVTATQIACTTKGKSDAVTHFDFSIEEADAEKETSDMLKVSLKDRTLATGTYTFKMTARYAKGSELVSAKPLTFKVKVIDSSKSKSKKLPKATANKKSLDVYLWAKTYDASFIVTPSGNTDYEIEDVYFAENDEKANESFELLKTEQKDGAMKVIVHLKEGGSFANGSSNSIKMYVKYKGQPENTSKTATSFTMKINVH